MQSPIRSLLSSKQAAIVALSGLLGCLGILGLVLDESDLLWLAVLALAILISAVAADAHRKIGRSMALQRRNQAESQEVLRQAIEEAARSRSSIDDLQHHLEAIERARQAAVSELSAFRSQFLTRFDITTSEFSKETSRLRDEAHRFAQLAEAATEARTDSQRIISEGTERLYDAMSKASRSLDRAVENLDDSIRHGFNETQSHVETVVTSARDRTATEVDAILQIHERIQHDGSMPLMGGWAMSPTGMKTLIDTATGPEVSLILELGSGASTVILARALERAGNTKTRVVSLEHLPEYAEVARSHLDSLGLAERVEVRYAPLESVLVDGRHYQWYEASGFDDLSGIDLLVVDGPPNATGSMARFPAYPILRSSLSAEAFVLVDDARRPDEKRMVKGWLEYGTLTPVQGYRPGHLLLQHTAT